jgi:hypothetical protein
VLVKRLLWVAAAAALCVSPAAARGQDRAGDATGMAALIEATTPAPLTAEQQARLPQARALMELVLPPGSYSELIGGMFGTMATPFPATTVSAQDVVARRLGLIDEEMAGVSEEAAVLAAALLDPAWQEREQRQAEAMPRIMVDVMGHIEAPMREAMAELYAINFSEEELADVAAFFATPSGAAYASRSYTMASDPRLSQAMLSVLPAVMGEMEGMMAQLEAVTADLPPERQYSDLTDTQRKQLARLVGLSEEQLQATFQSFDEKALESD